MELTGNVSGLINLGGGGSTVEVTPILTSGEHIADIEVDGVTSELYAPEPTEVEVTPIITSGVKIAIIEVDGKSTDIYVPDVGIHYSTNEQVIGTWIDEKPIYQKTFVFDNAITLSNGNTWYSTPIVSADYNMDKLIDTIAYSPTLSDIYKGITAEINSGQYLELCNYRYAVIQTLTVQYTKTTDTI